MVRQHSQLLSQRFSLSEAKLHLWIITISIRLLKRKSVVITINTAHVEYETEGKTLCTR